MIFLNIQIKKVDRKYNDMFNSGFVRGVFFFSFKISIIKNAAFKKNSTFKNKVEFIK